MIFFVPRGCKFPSSQVPKFPNSQVPKFPSSQVPKNYNEELERKFNEGKESFEIATTKINDELEKAMQQVKVLEECYNLELTKHQVIKAEELRKFKIKSCTD